MVTAIVRSTRYFDWQEFLYGDDLDAPTIHYEENGYCVLKGVESAITPKFFPELGRILGEGELRSHLEPSGVFHTFPVEVRRQLARVPTSESLATSLITELEPILQRLIGPVTQISSSFHAQFKGGSTAAVDHGGYQTQMQYMEVHGRYLLHQDFSGASLPTSPSAMTLWVPLNRCPDWTLRLYPGTHRLGLLCNSWIELNDPRLESFGAPVDIAAEPGTAVIFNSLLLHGTSKPGAGRRVSCDIRFFPLCRFLPTRPRLVGNVNVSDLHRFLTTAPGPVTQAPLLEDLAWLGAPIAIPEPPPCSVLNWAKYVECIRAGKPGTAEQYLQRFVNLETGVDPPEVFISKFHGSKLHPEQIRVYRA
jgi:hypothetical protein